MSKLNFNNKCSHYSPKRKTFIHPLNLWMKFVFETDILHTKLGYCDACVPWLLTWTCQCAICRITTIFPIWDYEEQNASWSFFTMVAKSLTKYIFVFTVLGNQHKKTVFFCLCKKDAIRLPKLHVMARISKLTWQVAFHFKVIMLADTLLLECQVSLKKLSQEPKKSNMLPTWVGTHLWKSHKLHYYTLQLLYALWLVSCMQINATSKQCVDNVQITQLSASRCWAYDADYYSIWYGMAIKQNSKNLVFTVNFMLRHFFLFLFFFRLEKKKKNYWARFLW